MTRFAAIFLTVLVAAPMVGCAIGGADTPAAQAVDVSMLPWAAASPVNVHPVAWQHFKLPGKQPSQFRYVVKDGRHAIDAYAESSASMLRQATRVEPDALGRIRFSWLLPELIRHADLSRRESDDSPVRIVLAFEGDRASFSNKNAILSELANVLTGEPMPYATLMYVWCNSCEPESVILNPHTDRVRKLPLESGPHKLNQWLDYERPVRADYLKAFGEEPGALISISIMTDTDNTESTARAWYGPVSLLPVGRK